MLNLVFVVTFIPLYFVSVLKNNIPSKLLEENCVN